MITKIHPTLLSEVNTLSKQNIDCFLYAKNFDELQSKLDINNIKYVSYPFMKCFFVHLSRDNILKFSKYESVDFITKSARVFTLIDKAKQFINIKKLDCYSLNPPTIAFIDTGINPHLDFLFPRNKIIHFKDLINNRKYPYDDNGHGTFISGIACGSGICSKGKFSGIMPYANIVMIKALDKSGNAWYYMI